MESNPLNTLVDILAVSGYSKFQINKILFQSGAHVVIPIEHCGGFLGGNINQLQPDQYGRLIWKNLIISPLLRCGHISRSINEIAGACHICKQLICTQCLLTCDLTGVLVCRKDSFIKDGVVIGNHARKGVLWRLKARQIRDGKELGFNARKQISYK